MKNLSKQKRKTRVSPNFLGLGNIVEIET